MTLLYWAGPGLTSVCVCTLYPSLSAPHPLYTHTLKKRGSPGKERARECVCEGGEEIIKKKTNGFHSVLKIALLCFAFVQGKWDELDGLKFVRGSVRGGERRG